MKTKTGMALAAGVLIVAGSAFSIQQYINWTHVAQRRAHAVQQLRDPDSVQFRAEKLTSAGWLCGELNSKNSYGVYTGFKRFMALGEDDAWIEGSGQAGHAAHGANIGRHGCQDSCCDQPPGSQEKAARPAHDV